MERQQRRKQSTTADLLAAAPPALAVRASAFACHEQSKRPLGECCNAREPVASEEASRGGCSRLRGAGQRPRSAPALGLRREVPPAAMRTRVRAPFAASPPPAQVA